MYYYIYLYYLYVKFKTEYFMIIFCYNDLKLITTRFKTKTEHNQQTK